jgi:hypothetical protein
MFFEGKVTTDPEVIKAWVEARKGYPAVTRHVSGSSISDVLQIGFTGWEDNSLSQIPWEEFFERFNRDQLVFLYQEDTNIENLRRSFGFL